MSDGCFARWRGPAAYLLLGLGLLWCAQSRIFVREDALEIPNYCGWLQRSPASRLLLTRAVGEDGAYYRPLENLFVGAMARTFGCADARPYRAAAGLVWLFCAASIVIPLRRAGVSADLSWGAAALLMAHPYNSWYFVSPVLLAGPALIPAAIGAWRAYEFAEEGGNAVAAGLGAAACVYFGCLGRENAVLIPVAVSAAVLGFKRPFSKSTGFALCCAFAAAGAYLLQRRWVLAHDPSSHAPQFQWGLVKNIGAACSAYLRIFLGGVYRVYGGMIPSSFAVVHLLLWSSAGAAAVLFAKSGRRVCAWGALILICGSEIAISATLNGEILPVRATGSIAFFLALAAWALSRWESAKKRSLVLPLCGALGIFWTFQSVRHALASRDADAFLEIHSNPPYSWKFEGERVAEWLRRGDPQKALAAAQASERLRPSWLTRCLRASVEAVYFRRGRLDELRELARAGRGESAAQIGYVDLGVAFGRNGAWLEAIECFRIATRLMPDYAEAWSQWAWAEVSLKDWARGAEAAQKAVALDPVDAHSWQNLAYSRLWMGDWSGAADAYRRFYALVPQPVATRIFWAFAEERAGGLEKAWGILTADPQLSTDPYAAAYLAYLGQKLRRPVPVTADPRLVAQISNWFPPAAAGVRR